MHYLGSCKCKQWALIVSTEEPLGNLSPRVCDCDYCQSHPSAIISAPAMIIELMGEHDNLTTHKNGDELATFYRCKSCGEQLAVGREFDGELRGAVNAWLLDQKNSLGPSVAIQPRLLSADDKVKRWGTLWGKLKIV